MAKDQSQKKRLPNFSNLEKMKLIDLIEREKNIIENKKTDNVNLKDKDTCWRNITNEFNSSSTSGHRDVACLKNCWDNLKKKTRKYYAEVRCEVFKTGGGKSNIINDPVAERVKRIIEPSVEGLRNTCDSDYMPYTDDDPQYSKQSENEQDFCDIEMLEEENSSTVTWAEWTPAKLNSKKSKELRLNSNKNEDLLTMEDVQTVLTSSCKENCNPAASNYQDDLPRRNLKRKKVKQLKVHSVKQNIGYSDLAQSKMELVEILKENAYKKAALEISILEVQLQKERLHVELLQKQLNYK